MAYTSRLYHIEQVVWRALHYADAEENQYDRFLQFAFDGLREIYRGVIKEGVVWTKVTPDEINRVTFPQDMEEFIGIGIPYGGKIWFLTERKDMIATYTEDDDGGLSLDSSDGEGVDLPTNQYENILSTGGFNLYGYFKVDWQNEEIIINSTSRSELILVYVTSGINASENAITYVPTRAAEALIAWILWRDALGRMKSPAEISVVEVRKREWNEEKTKLKKRELFTVREFRDVLSSTKSLLRR